MPPKLNRERALFLPGKIATFFTRMNPMHREKIGRDGFYCSPASLRCLLL